MLAKACNFMRSDPVAGAALVVLAVGSAAIGGALFFQHGLGYLPCPLCFEQRTPYYMAIPLAGLVAASASVGGSRKILVMSLVFIAGLMCWNAYLGIYHSGVEWKWWPGPADCSGPLTGLGPAGSLLNSIEASTVVRCDDAAWRFLGLSLAGYNAIISFGLACVAIWGAVSGWRQGAATARA